MRRTFWLCLLLVLLGCRAAPAPSPTATRAPSTTQPAPTVTPLPQSPLTLVRVGITQSPSLFSTAPSAPDALLRAWLATTAARRTDDGTLTPESATWAWEDDRTLRLTPTRGDFTLWHDALAGWRNQHPYGALVQALRADGTDVVVEWAQPPQCAAVSTLLQWPIVADPWPPSRTSGDFTLDPLDAATWRLQARQPNTPDLHLTLFDMPTTAWLNGDLDLLLGDAWLYGQPPPPALRAAAEDVPGFLIATLLFNTQSPPFDDAAVRLAFWQALDRAALYRDAYESEPHLVDALAPPGVVDGPAPAYDAQAAAARLDEAGWRDRDGDGVRENADGAPLRVQMVVPLSATDARWERLAPRMQAAWAQVGIAVELLYQTPLATEDRLHSPDWQLALVPFVMPNDADIAPLVMPPTDDMLAADLNLTRYNNPDVQGLAAEAATVATCNDAERNRLYTQMWAHIWRDMPFGTLFRLPERIFISETLRTNPTRAWLDASLCRAGLC